MSTVEKTTKSAVPPWGIEADHHRNCDLLFQSITNLRLRSRILASRTITDFRTGEKVVPTGQSASLGRFPEIPGMQIHVNPAGGTYKVIDPLHTDVDLCERIQARLNELTGSRTDTKLRGVPPQEGKVGQAGFDVHRMKTLCREMLWLVNSGEGTVIKGPTPDIDDIDQLDGKYLLNPGSKVTNTQPVFEADWDNWVANLTRSGG